MSKTKVSFSSSGAGDGLKPAETPWGVNLRTSVMQRIPAAESVDYPARVKVTFGWTCDVPLLVWLDPNMVQNGLQLEGGMQVLQPGEELSVVLLNKGSKSVELMERESVVRAHPLAGDFSFNY